MTCIYGCQKDGTPCPHPHTCHTIGVIKKQQDECCTGNCRQGRDCTRASYGMLDVQNENLMNFARNVVIYAGNSCDDYLADKAREVMRTNPVAGE